MSCSGNRILGIAQQSTCARTGENESIADGAKVRLDVDGLPGYKPEIGRVPWMLEVGRERKKATREGLTTTSAGRPLLA